MLTPEYLEGLPEALVVLMEDLEEWVISDIVRRLEKAGVTDTAVHQTIQLLEIYDETELKKKVEETTDRANDLVTALFDRAMEDSYISEQIIYAAAGKKPEWSMVEPLLEVSKQRLTEEVLNLTKSMGFAVQQGGKTTFKWIAEFYQDTLNAAQMQVMTGVLDYQSAIRRAVNTMSNSGLRTVEYASGASSRIDVAARRAVLTGVNQTSAEMTNLLMDQMGAEFVETSAHFGARPEHAIWQGKVYHVGGAVRYQGEYYPDFQTATGYGEVTGLCGANCRHTYYPFFPGISERAYTNKQLQQVNHPPKISFEGKEYTAYEATQMQRKYERNIRATKDRLVGYIESDDDLATAYAVRLKTLERGYKEFSRAAGLPTQQDRLQQFGFGRSVSAKAVWENRKYIEKYSGYRYNINGTVIATDDWKDRGHGNIPKHYRPYAIIETVSGKNKQIDRTFYDADALMVKQIHSGNHGFPKRHPYGDRGEHAHDYVWHKNGERDRKTRDLSSRERKENSDIL